MTSINTDDAITALVVGVATLCITARMLSVGWDMYDSTSQSIADARVRKALRKAALSGDAQRVRALIATHQINPSSHRDIGPELLHAVASLEATTPAQDKDLMAVLDQLFESGWTPTYSLLVDMDKHRTWPHAYRLQLVCSKFDEVVELVWHSAMEGDADGVKMLLARHGIPPNAGHPSTGACLVAALVAVNAASDAQDHRLSRVLEELLRAGWRLTLSAPELMLRTLAQQPKEMHIARRATVLLLASLVEPLWPEADTAPANGDLALGVVGVEGPWPSAPVTAEHCQKNCKFMQAKAAFVKCCLAGHAAQQPRESGTDADKAEGGDAVHLCSGCRLRQLLCCAHAAVERSASFKRGAEAGAPADRNAAVLRMLGLLLDE